MRTNENQDLRKPEGLSATGEAAYAVIIAFLRERGLTYTGGCRAFYSPAEWRGRGEDYCRNAELVVVFDGSAVAQAFSYDHAGWSANPMQGYATIEAMSQKLAEVGMYAEQGTHWYAGVYPIKP